jgi:hypothetical protein
MIKLGRKSFPIRFDFMSLKETYKKYGNIKKVQMDLLGMEVVGTDENGKDIMKIVKIPSVRMVLFLIPLMINTALDYQGKNQIEESKLIELIGPDSYKLAIVLHNEINRCFESQFAVDEENEPKQTKNDTETDKKDQNKLNFAEIFYVCKNKLGYTTHEAKHIYLGEYLEQFEVYKKYHNMEMERLLYPDPDRKEIKKDESGEQYPSWYTPPQKGSK